MPKIRVASTLQKVTEIVERHEKYRNSYFWKPPLLASDRRSLEEKNSTTFRFTFNHRQYEINQDVSCSGQYVYYRLTVIVDDKKKDVRALKAII